MERRHDHLDPQLAHDTQTGEEVLLGAGSGDGGCACRRRREAVEECIDVARREGGRTALQELCPREAAHRVVVVSFLRSSRRIRSASSPNCCDGVICSGSFCAGLLLSREPTATAPITAAATAAAPPAMTFRRTPTG